MCKSIELLSAINYIRLHFSDEISQYIIENCKDPNIIKNLNNLCYNNITNCIYSSFCAPGSCSLCLVSVSIISSGKFNCNEARILKYTKGKFDIEILKKNCILIHEAIISTWQGLKVLNYFNWLNFWIL